MVNEQDEGARRQLAELRVELGARAAGYWWHAGDWLEQVAFAASPTLDAEVARAFAEATRSVPLARTELGIVQAAVSGAVAVSRASDPPDDAEAGPGYWLRAFGAARSVAVPLHDPGAAVRAVVSVALPADCPFDDDAVAERILMAVRGWAPLV
jgi:hypothetical protein